MTQKELRARLFATVQDASDQGVTMAEIYGELSVILHIVEAQWDAAMVEEKMKEWKNERD